MQYLLFENEFYKREKKDPFNNSEIITFKKENLIYKKKFYEWSLIMALDCSNGIMCTSEREKLTSSLIFRFSKSLDLAFSYYLDLSIKNRKDIPLYYCTIQRIEDYCTMIDSLYLDNVKNN
tara:strand:- start:102 stop:464 length:363 start_codon:yes stop_codon:yes gene_type:complete